MKRLRPVKSCADRSARINLALDQAAADVAAAQSAINSKRAQLETRRAAIDAAKPASTSITSHFAAHDNNRDSDFAASGYSNVQNSQQTIVTPAR